MATRSSRRNNPTEFQQLSFEIGRQKRAKKNQQKQFKNIPKQEEQQKIDEKPFQIQNNQKRNEKVKEILLNQPKSTARTRLYQTKQITPQPIAFNNQHDIILEVVNRLISHELFKHLDEARLRPTTNSQIRQMRQKLKGFYRIDQFQADLDKIFRIFCQQADVNPQIIVQVKQMQLEIKTPLSIQSQNFQELQTESEESSVSLSKSKSKKSSKRISSKEKSKIKSLSKKKIISSISKDSQVESETTPIESKRQKKSKSLVVTPRSKLSKMSELQIANLGYNITKLPSQDLAIICYKFCDHNQSNETQTMFYNLDLEKMPKQALFELEAHVKNVYRQKNWKYENIEQEHTDEEFVINSDGQQQKK